MLSSACLLCCVLSTFGIVLLPPVVVPVGRRCVGFNMEVEWDPPCPRLDVQYFSLYTDRGIQQHPIKDYVVQLCKDVLRSFSQLITVLLLIFVFCDELKDKTSWYYVEREIMRCLKCFHIEFSFTSCDLFLVDFINSPIRKLYFCLICNHEMFYLLFIPYWL